jgi:phospholipid/cholesterol/gamma-HCH transport system substrate-binding protein
MLKNQFLPLKDQISDLVTTLKVTVENLNGMIDADAKRNIASSLENLNKTLAGAKAIVQNLEKSGPEITQLISNINSLSGELTQTTQKLNYGLDNIGQITDSLKTADLAGTVNSLKELLEQMNNPQGTVGKLLSTDSVHNSIELLIRDLDILIKNITENPKKYIKISVF